MTALPKVNWWEQRRGLGCVQQLVQPAGWGFEVEGG
ncbi:hypothetical protein M2428_004371, partial [Arthrobacter sp. ES3-54]|nr:hypothetical protein [Arthrobacter sp. ES3-54]